MRYQITTSLPRGPEQPDAPATDSGRTSRCSSFERISLSLIDPSTASPSPSTILLTSQDTPPNTPLLSPTPHFQPRHSTSSTDNNPTPPIPPTTMNDTPTVLLDQPITNPSTALHPNILSLPPEILLHLAPFLPYASQLALRVSDPYFYHSPLLATDVRKRVDFLQDAKAAGLLVPEKCGTVQLISDRNFLANKVVARGVRGMWGCGRAQGHWRRWPGWAGWVGKWNVRSTGEGWRHSGEGLGRCWAGVGRSWGRMVARERILLLLPLLVLILAVGWKVFAGSWMFDGGSTIYEIDEHTLVSPEVEEEVWLGRHE